MATLSISGRISRLYLTGFMGSGKSTVGPLLSRTLGFPYLDLDNRIEQTVGRTIQEIFSVEGENAFRARETDTLRTLIETGYSGIIATGGGTPVNPANRLLMRTGGSIIYLAAPFETLWERISGDSGRPLLMRGKQYVEELYAAREQLYEDADILIDTKDKSPMQTVDDILSWLKYAA